MDGPATRGGVPLADCPAIPPARSRCGVRGRVLEASAVHGDPRSQDGGSVALAESVRGTAHRRPPPRVSRPRRGAERNPSASPAERVPHLLPRGPDTPLPGEGRPGATTGGAP